MKSIFFEKEIAYDGTQLKSHWILDRSGLYGDAIAVFIGSCRVELANMVDWEDVIRKSPIFSEKMLHFIVEHFDCDLEKMILRQRLLVSLIQQELQISGKINPVLRRGDDLYKDDRKLTVSIATSSPVSSLIHTAINIISHGTPVPALGLDDFKMDPVAFGKNVMKAYREEMEGVSHARSKVRGVL